MPTFQMLAVCAVVMTSRAAKRLFAVHLKASTKPIMIGMRQATRAVVLGTMNDNRKPTTMAPITMWCVLAPTFDSTVSAMRRSSPVAVMADAIKHAAATSATALLAKARKREVQRRAGAHVWPVGLGHAGRIGQQNTISAAITTALAEYSSASVIHTITAKARMASIVCPAKGKPAGGSASTSISASTAPTRPSCWERLPEGAAGVALGAWMTWNNPVCERERSAEGHFSETRADPVARPGAG